MSAVISNSGTSFWQKRHAMPDDLPKPEKSIQEIEREQMARLKAKAKKGTIMLDE